jgi:hypothetical protein
MVKENVKKDKLKIIDLYVNKHYSMDKISQLYYCTSGTIFKYLRKWGVSKPNQAKSLSKRLTKNPAWKAGQLFRGGYLFVKADNHPYKNNKGYVAKHRLVAEEKLGRYLKDKEVVHHLDNNKINNSIENIYVFNNCGEHKAYHHFLNRTVLEAVNGN